MTSDPRDPSAVPASTSYQGALSHAASAFLSHYAEASHPEFLVAAYRYFLNRGLDEQGYSAYLTLLYRGMPRADVLRAFIESEEFRKLPLAALAPLLELAPKPAAAPLPPRSSLEQYQDIWIKGKVHQRGIRECAKRFELIREFCAQFKRPFTILDIGSNLGYFSLRLTEAFDCTSLAVEGIYGEWIQEVFEANQNPRVILARKVVKLADLRALAEVEHFDVVLGLSVIHHLDGTFDESLEVLRSLGDHLILELPFEPNACGQAIVKQTRECRLPADAVLMGFGESHLAEGKRQIVRLSRPKTRITKSYLGTPRSDLSLTIHSDFDSKTVEFHNKPEHRPWLRGVNLQTYLWLNGAYPRKEKIAEAILATIPADARHRDIQPWNVVVQGDAVQLIDADDPNHAFTYDDKEYRERLVRLLFAGTAGEGASANDGGERLALPVRWRGPIFNPSGYASEAINFVLPLAEHVDLGILHLTGIYSEKFVAGLADGERQRLLALSDRYSKLKGGIVVDHNPAQGFRYVPDAAYRIGRTMFETDRIPANWVPACNQMDEIWVPSQFNVETFAASGVLRDKLVVMPAAVDEDFFDPAAHQPLPLPNRAAFNFLAIFEWSSRKAWDVLLSAYLKEFSAEDDVCLYLRTYPFSRPDGDPKAYIWQLINDYAATLNLPKREWPRIEVIAEQVRQADLPGLYKAVDCLVAPSRGEGWGRPHHEAMTMGLPVIATNWSANTEFMNSGNSYLIDYSIVTAEGLEPELSHYEGHRWADPSEAHLREVMRHVQQRPEDARAKGQRARSEMLAKYSRRAVTELVLARLKTIEARLKTPACNPVSARVRRAIACQRESMSVSVNWEGTFHDFGSLSHVNRQLTSALAAEGVNVARVAKKADLKVEPAFQDIAAADHPDSSAEVTVRHSWPPDWTQPKSGAWVVMQPWEFGVLPADWIAPLRDVDEVWANSEYVRRVYIESGVSPEKVKIVPNGIDPNCFSPEAAPLALATKKKYKFLFVGGTIQRKGPDVLLDAYLKAFTSADDVCLVIKDFGGNSVYQGQTFAKEIEAARSRPDAPEILYITEDLAPEQVPSLYTACDCLVHPYRGEGFGLPVLEAMACGLPVVVTAGGSTDDFATDEFAYRIPARRQQIPAVVSNVTMLRAGWWLEPDHAALTEQLLWVLSHSAEARERGQAASKWVREHWTWKQAAQIATKHLQDLVARKQAEFAALAPHREKEMATIATLKALGSLDAARELMLKGYAEAAWSAVITAVGERPFHPEAMLLLAEIAQMCGNGTLARKCATEARDLAPHWRAPKHFLRNALKTCASPDWLALPAEWTRPAGLTVCVIAKNEEAFIGRCLDSVKGIATQLIVVDTGSTDRTRELAAERGAEVVDFTWCDDFSVARNAALAQARGEWILMLDADEELPAEQHAALRADMNRAGVIAYRLPLVNEGQKDGQSYVPRLFRNAPGAHYVGRIHEQVFPSLMPMSRELGLEFPLGTAQLLHHGYSEKVVSARRKVGRNLQLLRLAVREQRNDPNLVMNLGLELVRSGEFGEGLDRYRQAFRLMSAQDARDVVPELREVLLTQYTWHLYCAQAYGEIVSVLSSPLAKNALTASQHFSLGLAYHGLKRFQEAAAQMRQCIAKRRDRVLSPINTDILTSAPYHCLAHSLSENGDAKGADSAFKSALSDPKCTEKVKLDYARFLARNKRQVDALQMLHQIVTANAQSVTAWRLGGDVALQQPEFVEVACDWTSEALRLHPGDNIILAQRAEALLRAGDSAQAKELWQRVCNCARPPRALAALIICTAASSEAIPQTKTGAEEVATSKAFIDWYQALLAAGARQTILTLNSRIEDLRPSLPTAARLLDIALADARN